MRKQDVVLVKAALMQHILYSEPV